jgi:DNA-binding IclR family transcriptional regulator
MDVNARNPIKSVRTAVRIVETLVERDGATVSELAEATPITKGTAHNHLATLRERGYVTKEGDTYHVGLRFCYPASHATARTPLANVSTVPIAELAEATGQRVDLVTTEEHRAVLVHSEQGPRYDGPEGVAGTTLPLDSSAPGKTILAHHDDLSPADAAGPGVDADNLRDELNQIREEGLAYDRGELYPDQRGVAVPIIGEAGIQGAVGVLGPDSYMRGKTFQQDVPGLVISAAEQVTKRRRDR